MVLRSARGWVPGLRVGHCLQTIGGRDAYHSRLREGVRHDVTTRRWRGARHRPTWKWVRRWTRELLSSVVVRRFPIALGSRPRVECQRLRLWWAGTPLRSFVDSASWMARPYRHLDMARTSAVDTRLPLLFPWWYVGSDSLCQRHWDQVRHHYGTKVLSNRDLLPLQGSVKLLGKASVEGRWTWGAK